MISLFKNKITRTKLFKFIAGQLIFISIFALPSNALTLEWGDLILDSTSSSMIKAGVKKVLFPHWIHRIRYRCKTCHPLIFEMEKGGNHINMGAIIAGKACGRCHNGDIAFSAVECSRCHKVSSEDEAIYATYGYRSAPLKGSSSHELKSLDPEKRWNIYSKPDAIKNLAVDKYGLVDWVNAILEQKITPLKTIEAGGQDRFRDSFLEIIAKSDYQNDVLYPHDIHTYYVDCDSCHPRPFVQKSGKNSAMRMNDMSEGKWCGKCHGKVAFPLDDCTRCHVLGKDRKENGTAGYEQTKGLGK